MSFGRFSLLISWILAVSACSPGLRQPTAQNPYKLPLDTIFKGEDKFQDICDKAVVNNWRNLPIGERTMRIAHEMLGTDYVNFTLEVDDHLEAPVVNFHAKDCWTFYENSLAMARMIHQQNPPYHPIDMLRYVEMERYRGGYCDGSYLSRMHHLEEVFHDNQRRGIATNITPNLPGAQRLSREIREMTVQWKSYRYLRSNPSLIGPMADIEKRVSRLPVYHIPKSAVRDVESHLLSGDICAITSLGKYGYTSHVGLILKSNARAYFVHATSDRDKGRQVIIDRPITSYLHEMSKHAGIIICRPKDLPAPEQLAQVDKNAS
jgi:hypothetical protein